MWLAINKKQKYFSLTCHQLVENSIIFLCIYQRTKKDKKQICNYICRNCSYDYFSIKISLKFHVKSSLQNFFHWSLETQNHKQNNLSNALSKSLPTNVHISWRDFQLLWTHFKAFRISWLNSQHIFDHFWIFLIWFFKYVFCKNELNKTV